MQQPRDERQIVQQRAGVPFASGWMNSVHNLTRIQGVVLSNDWVSFLGVCGNDWLQGERDVYIVCKFNKSEGSNQLNLRGIAQSRNLTRRVSKPHTITLHSHCIAADTPCLRHILDHVPELLAASLFIVRAM